MCKDIDIRNRVSGFKQLENCTVIEGTLQILLIDYAESEEYENLQFPDLVEITHYFLLYRVYGLKTLRNIFPNLAVIRGQKLFWNYALVAFEMPDLEELGLKSLTSILRGSVRLEKNHYLCYIDTLDWKLIAPQSSKEDHFMVQNKAIDECVNICPKNPDGSPKCKSRMIDGSEREVCWTQHDCQTGESISCMIFYSSVRSVPCLVTLVHSKH